MKQPKNELEIFFDEEEVLMGIDIIGENGCGFCNVGIGCGKTEKSAYKAAARRLYKLATIANKKHLQLKKKEDKN